MDTCDDDDDDDDKALGSDFVVGSASGSAAVVLLLPRDASWCAATLLLPLPSLKTLRLLIVQYAPLKAEGLSRT